MPNSITIKVGDVSVSSQGLKNPEYFLSFIIIGMIGPALFLLRSDMTLYVIDNSTYMGLSDIEQIDGLNYFDHIEHSLTNIMLHDAFPTFEGLHVFEKINSQNLTETEIWHKLMFKYRTIYEWIFDQIQDQLYFETKTISDKI